MTPGSFVSADGQILGVHKGFACYTVGQRKGLGIALGQPMFVSAIDPLTNRVTLGSEADIFATGLIAGDFNWVSGATPVAPFQALAKIRYNAAASAASIHLLPDMRVKICFVVKQRAITPGQSVVLYDGNCVMAAVSLE